MESFGRKMRQVVADRGLRLDQLVKETGLPIEHLQALGCDDFGVLPDDDIVENGLRSFAQLVGVDPQQVVEDYRRERRAWLDSVETLKVAAVDPIDETPPERRGRVPALATWTVAVLSLAVLVFFWLRSPATGSAGPAEAPVKESLPTAPEPISSPDHASPLKPAPVTEPSIKATAPPSSLSIPQHGVGREVIDHQLVGVTDRFTSGEHVWFWTRVEGGAGETIDHVWFHEGSEVLRVPLKVGGARWRTHSYKSLTAGSEGSWAVEAQDETGRVLARREFVCAPTP